MGEGLRRARADLQQGRPWKAKERLEGLLASDPANQEVLTLLAKTCYMMGDLPAAGRYWFLTSEEGEEATAAQIAMGQRHRGAAAVLTNLPVGTDLEAYPPVVRERLLKLAGEVKDDAPWLRFTPKMRRVTGESAGSSESWGDSAIIGSIVVAAVGPWLVGLGALGYGVWKLVSRS